LRRGPDSHALFGSSAFRPALTLTRGSARCHLAFSRTLVRAAEPSAVPVNPLFESQQVTKCGGRRANSPEAVAGGGPTKISSSLSADSCQSRQARLPGKARKPGDCFLHNAAYRRQSRGPGPAKGGSRRLVVVCLQKALLSFPAQLLSSPPSIDLPPALPKRGSFQKKVRIIHRTTVNSRSYHWYSMI
jgi:hypothetical protein